MRALTITLAILCLLCPAVVARVNDTDGREGERLKAEQLWEQAIAAKGGRERLRGVGNIAISARVKGRKNLVTPAELRYEELYVFPNKGWQWVDETAISPLGLKVEWFDIERGLKYLTYPNDPESPRKLKTYPRERHFLFETQLVYLMETKWLKPVPLKTWAARIGFKKVDVVQTNTNRERVDFYLDRESHLPVKLVRHYTVEDERTIEAVFRLEDYADVSGIQMPQTVVDDGVKQRVDIQLNVQYDVKIFERPPMIEMGPEGWKLAKR